MKGKVKSLISLCILLFFLQSLHTKKQQNLSPKTSITNTSLATKRNEKTRKFDNKIKHKEGRESSNDLVQKTNQKTKLTGDLILNYNTLEEKDSDAYITIYKKMCRISDQKIFDAIYSDMISDGFPKLPNQEISSYGILKFSYIALANSIQNNASLEKIRDFLKTPIPNLITGNSQELKTNLNRTALICSLGISGKPEIFNILREEYITSPSIDNGVGMAAFWYDYKNQYYKYFFINANHALEPFYDDNFFLGLILLRLPFFPYIKNGPHL